MRFPMSMIRQLLYGVESLGLDLHDLLNELQLSEAALADTAQKLSWQQGIKVWEMVLLKSADKDFGLHMGRHISIAMAGLVGHIMERSKNLYEAACALEKFQPLANEMFEVQCRLENKYLLLHIQPIALWKLHSPETARQALMMSFSSILHIIELLTARPIKPAVVEFSSAAPENLPAYQALFQAELRFHQPEDKLIFKESDVFTPIIGYHQEILATLTEMAEGKLLEHHGATAAGLAVQQWIAAHWQHGFPQIATVADALHMSVRTLQRRLQQEGTSFQQVLEECHQQIGCSLLKNTHLPVSEIALMLGYADAQAFRRAFKRRTGKNPLAFRNA